MTSKQEALKELKQHIRFNSTQLNIVTFVDVQKAILNKSLDGAVYMMDNSPDSINQGTSFLETTCKQGQVLNWIIYPLDSERRPDGTWPPMVKISNIVFLNDSVDWAVMEQTMENLKIFGSPDKIRPVYTPVYYYWAGTIPVNLPVKTYKYRLILELENELCNKSEYFNLDISLRSISI